MGDSLKIRLALSNSAISSQQPVTAAVTITDTSDTPRNWTLTDEALWVYPGDAALPGLFLSASNPTIVPAGGSVTVSAQLVFKSAPVGTAKPNYGIQYTVGASFTAGGSVFTCPADQRPTVWVMPPNSPDVSTNNTNIPSSGQLDLRSNLLSGLIPAALCVPGTC